MNRFTVRLSDQTLSKLEEIADNKGLSKVGILRQLINKEGNPAYFEIDTELLMNVYMASEYEIPEKLKEQYQRMQAIHCTAGLSKKEKDKVALKLLERYENGERLEEEEKKFLDKWTAGKRNLFVAERGLRRHQKKNDGDDNE